MSRFLAWLSAALIRTLACTVRVKITDRGGVILHPEHTPVIIAFWHNRTLLMAVFWERYCKPRKSLTFISRSRDGQFMSAVAAQFGIQSARGSSSRHGAAAALAAVHGARDPQLDIVITPDGPRGPRYQVQPGLLRLAQTTGRPIVAITYELAWKHELKSWDRFHIPIPFSRCELITSIPIAVPDNATEEELAIIKEKVCRELGED